LAFGRSGDATEHWGGGAELGGNGVGGRPRLVEENKMPREGGEGGGPTQHGSGSGPELAGVGSARSGGCQVGPHHIVGWRGQIGLNMIQNSNGFEFFQNPPNFG
jgi:hypothetical protein